MSPATADLLLADTQQKLEIRGVNTTRAAHTPLWSQIPVRTGFDWGAMKPGFFAFDTVAHCGGAMSGQFCKTLTGTGVFSGWIEERALPNAANRWVFDAFSDIQGSFPSPLRALITITAWNSSMNPC
ncbi:MAG: hypothetical protein LBP76_10590 [Treponema sp.]|nr:hypothetical protein [Treponema sp.]